VGVSNRRWGYYALRGKCYKYGLRQHFYLFGNGEVFRSPFAPADPETESAAENYRDYGKSIGEIRSISNKASVVWPRIKKKHRNGRNKPNTAPHDVIKPT
jgi:hypothetical protein